MIAAITTMIGTITITITGDEMMAAGVASGYHPFAI